VVDLNNGSRPAITASYLAGAVGTTPNPHFQGVVLPNTSPAGLSADELTALSTYESTYGIREVDGYIWPSPAMGLNYPTYSGSLDAATVTVSTAAKAAGFGYLNGTYKFDGQAGGSSSYGYLSTVADATNFTPYLTATTADNSATGVLAGVYTTGKRQQLELSFGYNYYQLQFRYISHGIVDWVTKGVHFGYWRNWFDVHIDDVFNYDAIWSTEGKCTPGDLNCDGYNTTPVRMSADDVTYLKNWQTSNDYTMDMVFNGGASEGYKTDNNVTTDPLLVAFKNAGANNFRWINHTYTHLFLGCQQDFSVLPWRCVTDSSGNTVWVSSATINSEITKNISWASTNGIPINRAEMVAGEHSGTMILPQQPVDNPNFVKAMGANKIQVTGLDASREPALRSVGAAMGAPRHPINVFYNVSTAAQEISEYNWIYTSKADGGSGLCEGSTTSTCISPLGADGWSNYILPQAESISLGFVLANDPRTFYMHQSNLVGDKLAYQVVGGMLNAYRAVYASNTPVVNGSFLSSAQDLNNQQNWTKTVDGGRVHGYVQGNKVVITGPYNTKVPVTAPNQTKNGLSNFGSMYAGERSAYLTIGLLGSATLTLPSTPFPG